jgi:hypothetical protein
MNIKACQMIIINIDVSDDNSEHKEMLDDKYEHQDICSFRTSVLNLL